MAPQLPRDRRRRPPEPAGDLSHAVTLRPQQGDLLPLREGQIAPGERLRRPRQVRRRHPARLPEPAEADRLRDPHRHRRVLARQTCRDERPEPTPILTPRYPRPSRRPQLTPPRPIRKPPTRHRNRPPSSCCDDRLRPGNELCSLKGRSSDVSAPRRASICISRFGPRSMGVRIDVRAQASILRTQAVFLRLRSPLSQQRSEPAREPHLAHAHGSGRGRAKDARQRSQLHRSLRFSERNGTRVAQATFFTPSLVSEKKL